MENAQKIRQRIVREWPMRASSDEAVRFVQDLGVRLSRQYGGRGSAIDWHFALVRNLDPNAFSIGAGYVFVSEGAVTFAQNESELAAILAHELGHELAGHFCRVPGSGGGGFFDIFPQGPPRETREAAGVGSLTQTIEPEKERQADQIAVSILRASGYDPRALLKVARRLPVGGQGHLGDAVRVRNLERLVAGFPSDAESRDSARFQKVRRILLEEAPTPKQ